MNKTATLPASSTPGAISQRDVRFYVGCEALKLKSVDKTTGASFTSAYLCPTVGGDPIKRELALDMAALSIAAPRLLEACQTILGIIEANGDITGLDTASLRDAVKVARREVGIEGIISPEIVAAMTK